MNQRTPRAFAFIIPGCRFLAMLEPDLAHREILVMQWPETISIGRRSDLYHHGGQLEDRNHHVLMTRVLVQVAGEKAPRHIAAERVLNEDREHGPAGGGVDGAGAPLGAGDGEGPLRADVAGEPFAAPVERDDAPSPS